MNKDKAIAFLNMAINGDPVSCSSEHARRLSDVRDWLSSATSPDFVADAPRPPTLPRRFGVRMHCKLHELDPMTLEVVETLYVVNVIHNLDEEIVKEEDAVHVFKNMFEDFDL